jgi:transposase-like protein
MLFEPPRCPNVACEKHLEPTPGFCIRRGYYSPACRPKPVQRYLCKSCEHSFSRQTFRHDYGDQRPECNARFWTLLVSGIGLRQLGRVLDLNIRSVQEKKRKMARACALLHDNLSASLPPGRTYLLDEEETFEGASIRPLTMPVLIEKDTWFVVSTAVGKIRRLAQLGSARRVRQDLDEKDSIRPDESRACVKRVLLELDRRVPAGAIPLRTDQKASYAVIAREVFGDRLEHTTTAGTRIRSTHNPLFPINTTMAMSRDNMGRLRRRSWLVTKVGEQLQNHLALFTVYRNYVRRRFNRDQENETPARILKLLPRRLRNHEVVAWRQDWGARSIHPMSFSGSLTVRQALPA